ncbi:MAG TPA: DUF2267 domain-containing protein [Polyangiaceae bacterium]|nr:DUF2267 domain-containing protein [Polyangiaceae bacterium]
MRFEDFVREVRERTGLGQVQAGRAAECCVQALAEGLSELPARHVRAGIPPELQPFATPSNVAHWRTARDYFERVRELEGVPMGMALEHAEVVLQTVYGSIDNEARRLLREDLPPALLEVAQARPAYHRPPPRPVPPPRITRRTVNERSLAVGNPRSDAPVSEAGARLAEARRMDRERAALDEAEEED